MDSLALRSEPLLAALGDDDSLDPEHAAVVPDDLAISLYEHMVVARALDQRLVTLQREGVIAAHASAAGEEATVFGAVAAMNDDDWVFPSSREVGAALWRGMPLSVHVHQRFGNVRAAGKGRAAPDPTFWKAGHIASVSPLIGTQIPHAVGFAWAARMQSRDVAALVFFGEGATSSGDFHTGLNLAGVTRAPVVAVCRNNGHAMSTPAVRQTASKGFAIKAIAYGLHGVEVDGSDVVAVLSVVRAARRRAAAGRGATLIEAVIPGLDRADPIARMRRHIESRGLWTTDREEQLGLEVRSDIDRALADATGAVNPDRATLFEDVFAEVPWHLKEQGGA